MKKKHLNSNKLSKRFIDALFLKAHKKGIMNIVPNRIYQVLKSIPYNEYNLNRKLPFPSMFLYGNYDTGKTIAACKQIISYKWAAKLASKVKDYPSTIHDVCFLDSDTLMDINGKLEFGSARHSEFIHYRDCGLLIIDDLHTFKNTDYTYEILSMLFNHRYNAMLPIVITSNISLEELAEKFDDGRLCSRILRMCTPEYIIKFNKQLWKDR